MRFGGNLESRCPTIPRYNAVGLWVSIYLMQYGPPRTSNTTEKLLGYSKACPAFSDHETGNPILSPPLTSATLCHNLTTRGLLTLNNDKKS